MLGLKAKAGLLFFVSAGIFISLVAFGNFIAPEKINAVPEKKDMLNIAHVTDSLQNAIGEPMPIVTEIPPISFSELRGASDAPIDASTNLTANLASLIGKSIVDKNPEGPTGDNLTVLSADGMASEAITESLKHFNPAYFSPDILQSELTINDAQTSAAYHVAAARIISDSESQPPPTQSDSVAAKMKTFAKRYADEAIALRALAVPPSLVTEHMKAVRTAVGRERILEAVADYENDPIYAMLALKLWDTLK